ncbi:hypothetical protein [Microbispora bryophytorum]|uniref:hypothetical protein n=1 Tax=Microbispora bryophytorum TaxID=1460882 RepID=UPI0033D194DE
MQPERGTLPDGRSSAELRAGGRVIVSSAGTDWPIRDPDGAPLEVVRAIRDEIKTRIQALITEIDAHQES